MKALTSQEILTIFLDYFVKNDHLLIPGASLVPQNDPSLLFINSGMAPLKNYFLGKKEPPQKTLCNVQPCIRTIDIEDVGDRHHMTLFDMLGSWSIGDYYKEKAVELAWNLLIDEFKFPPEKLYVTVYKGNPQINLAPDEETKRAWIKIGVPEDHIVMLGEDNFWGPAGETGPCGPCTEVFFDTGEEFGPTYTPGSDFDTHRYIEIWNAGVFMELNKNPDGSFTPLPLKSVDTGSGLERMEMVMNGFQCVYDTSLLKPLLDLVKQQFKSEKFTEREYRIILDHIRAAVFIISEGIAPSNVGQGYIPRRLIRKSTSLAIRSGVSDTSFTNLIDKVIELNATNYPHLKSNRQQILDNITKEVNEFEPIVISGLDILREEIDNTSSSTLPAKLIFDLVTSHGLPLEIIKDYISSYDKIFSKEEYFKLFSEHQETSKKGLKRIDSQLEKEIQKIDKTTFTGYENDQETVRILSILDSSILPKDTPKNEHWVITDKTCFYGESGGQIGDAGSITSQDVESEIEVVEGKIIDTIRIQERIIHKVILKTGKLKIGNQINLQVDENRRDLIRANHSATHLLHLALQKVLGEHAIQKGSLVTDERLRFDFHHNSPVTKEDMQKIELLVNSSIKSNFSTQSDIMDIEKAMETNAKALFQENYAQQVRVISIGPESREFCGGNHVKASGDIGLFLLCSETGIGKGIRRVEAITGDKALQVVHDQQNLLSEVNTLLGSNNGTLISRIKKLRDIIKTNKLKNNKVSNNLNFDFQHSTTLGKGARLFVGKSSSSFEAIKHDVDNRIHNNNADLICIVGIDENIAKVVISIHEKFTGQLHAGQLMKEVITCIDGKGGGKPQFAQGAGPKIEAAQQLLDTFTARATEILQ